MEFTPSDELTNKVWGPIGSTKRDTMEAQIKKEAEGHNVPRVAQTLAERAAVILNAQRLHAQYLEENDGKGPSYASADIRFKNSDEDEGPYVIALTDDTEEGLAKMEAKGIYDDDIFFFADTFYGLIDLCEKPDDFYVTHIHYFD